MGFILISFTDGKWVCPFSAITKNLEEILKHEKRIMKSFNQSEVFGEVGIKDNKMKFMSFENACRKILAITETFTYDAYANSIPLDD